MMKTQYEGRLNSQPWPTLGSWNDRDQFKQMMKILSQRDWKYEEITHKNILNKTQQFIVKDRTRDGTDRLMMWDSHDHSSTRFLNQSADGPTHNGTSIADLKIGKVIGTGAYAVVWIGVHLPSHWKVAVKIYEKYKLKEP